MLLSSHNSSVLVKYLLITTVIILGLAAIYIWFSLSTPLNNSSGRRSAPSQEVACTLEAKICPDGSAVGRRGPNCEFSPCPGE